MVIWIAVAFIAGVAFGGFLAYTWQGWCAHNPVQWYIADTLSWEFLSSGLSGYPHLERGWLRIVQELFGLFCRKSHDYGEKNAGLGGVKGIVLRMGDKMSRLWTLSGLDARDSRPAVHDEALDDTLKDLANYAIIALMLRRGFWKTYSPDEVWSLPESAEAGGTPASDSPRHANPVE